MKGRDSKAAKTSGTRNCICSAVVVSIPVPIHIIFIGQKRCRDGDTYDYSLQLHYIYKSFHEMKGDRDGKSVKRSATAYSAVVSYYVPRPGLYHF